MERQTRHSRNLQAFGSAAFTLIELLVVISIMSLLMSILLPTLGRARELGKRVVCLSNLRQLTFAWVLYTMDNDDKLCSADTEWDVPPANHWVADGPIMPGNNTGGTSEAIENGVLWPQSGKILNLYKCKSDRSELLRSFSISRAMNGTTCNCEHDNIRPFRMLTEISRPSEKMVFVDAASRKEWIEGSFCPVEQIDAVPLQWFQKESHNITARHSNGCNFSFADGHCSYWKYKDQRTVDLANWQIDPIDASDENPDLEYIVQSLQGRYQN